LADCLAWMQFAAAAGAGEADLITMVAVLHHLRLDDTLARIPGLLAPGGRLLVVGLARADSLPDLAVDLVSAAANPVVGVIKHPRRRVDCAVDHAIAGSIAQSTCCARLSRTGQAGAEAGGPACRWAGRARTAPR
jgi:D-arabinose 1-dehydrogenase-like Zn-dependent alcohol dehydrogenase